MSERGIKETTTTLLWQRIAAASSIDAYLTENEEHLETRSLSQYLNLLCLEQSLVREHVIARAGLERGFGHQIFRGTKKPSRDKLLQLAFGFPLTVTKTQRMLITGGKRTLHPRIKRDNVLIFCLQNGISLLNAQGILFELGLPLLGDERS